MQIRNAFNLSVNDLFSKKLICKSQAKSLAYGRRVFYWQEDIKNDGQENKQSYWLKTQMLQSEIEFEKSFQRELNFYQSLTFEEAQKIALNFQIISHITQFEKLKLGMPLLVLPHAKLLFDENVQTLSIDQIKHKMIQALSVLENLHKAGWLHADLKTEHFVVDGRKAKLIDFEQSVKIVDIEKNTYLTATPRYMAPELFHGEVKSIESDIYALGIIFYEWLKQERLSAKNYYDWAVLHCQKLEIELPEAYLCFKTTLNTMLNKKKMHRLTDISALKMHLITENV